jgi:hypothetical protein
MFEQPTTLRSIAASRVYNRTVVANGIDTAMIQEPWYTEGRIMGLNIPGYSYFLFCLSGIGVYRPRARILARNTNTWRLTGFSSRDLVAILINYNAGEAERRLVVCSASLLMIRRTLLRQRSLRNWCATVKRKTSI